MGPRAPRPTGDTGDRSTAGQALYGLMTAAVRRGDRDMSLTSASTLATLDQTGPRRITDLAAVEGVAQPSMTVLVSALERSGLVERRVDPADRRVTLVALTPTGADYLRRRRRAGAEAFDRLIEKLAPDEAGTLKAAMTALAHLRALDEEERDPGNRSDSGQTAASDR
jgi:DNA-binding MarR family transcriptional regulator